MGDVAAVAAAHRRVVLIERQAAHQRGGLAAPLLEKERHVVQAVLPIRVHLQRMGKATRGRLAQAGHDRRALAAVALEAQHLHPRLAQRQRA